MSSFCKSDTNPKVLTTLTKDILNKYQDYSYIYTDGSKSQLGTGFGVIMPQSTSKIKLPETTSIYIAELMAILHALNIAEKE